MEGLCTVLETSDTCSRICVRFLPLWKMCLPISRMSFPFLIPRTAQCALSLLSDISVKRETLHPWKNVHPWPNLFFPFPQIVWETSATLWLCTDLPEQVGTLGSICQSIIGTRSHVTYWYADHVTMEWGTKSRKLSLQANNQFGNESCSYFRFIFLMLIICFLFSNLEAVDPAQF